jgi:hypothetical protein
MFADDDFRFAFDHPAAGIFHGGEGFRQNFVEPLRQLLVVRDFGKLILPRGGFPAQFIVGELLKPNFDFIDPANDRPEFFQLAVIPRPEDHFYEPNHDDSRKIASETLREETQSVKANRYMRTLAQPPFFHLLGALASRRLAGLRQAVPNPCRRDVGAPREHNLV